MNFDPQRHRKSSRFGSEFHIRVALTERTQNTPFIGGTVLPNATQCFVSIHPRDNQSRGVGIMRIRFYRCYAAAVPELTHLAADNTLRLRWV